MMTFFQFVYNITNKVLQKNKETGKKSENKPPILVIVK